MLLNLPIMKWNSQTISGGLPSCDHYNICWFSLNHGWHSDNCWTNLAIHHSYGEDNKLEDEGVPFNSIYFSQDWDMAWVDNNNPIKCT